MADFVLDISLGFTVSAEDLFETQNTAAENFVL
jgi:hypothetical protein